MDKLWYTHTKDYHSAITRNPVTDTHNLIDEISNVLCSVKEFRLKSQHTI